MTSDTEDFGARIRDFMREFSAETDRAAVIIGAAKLDYLLYQLLSKFLLPSPTSNDEFLEGDAPLGTFSARINAAYRLGLIDASFARSLHLTRRLRNAFAHEPSSCSLDKSPHADRVRELMGPLKSHPAFVDMLMLFAHDKPPIRGGFFAVLGLMVGSLEGKIETTISLSPGVPRPIAPPWYTEARVKRDAQGKLITTPQDVPKGQK